MYTGTRLTTAIHRRLLSQFFLREGGHKALSANLFPYLPLPATRFQNGHTIWYLP